MRTIVQDLPATFRLVNRDTDMAEVLNYLGLRPDPDIEAGKLPQDLTGLPGCLFVRTSIEDVEEVYSCEYIIPVLTHEVERIYPLTKPTPGE